MSDANAGARLTPAPPAKIMIVEDDPIVSAHFADIVRSSPSLELVGAASSLAAARKELACAPDLVLLDIGLPDGSGLSFIGEIHASCKALVLMVTTFGDRETVVAALREGADGYLLKDSNVATILAGIEATLAGGAPISPAAAVYLLDSLRAPAADEPPGEAASGFLTAREVELLKLFARGASYKEAARELEISPLTVGNHVKSIYRKLAVNSRGEAVYSAMRSGQLKV
jgi:DNA-binding NarL/FixJ family response regulator